MGPGPALRSPGPAHARGGARRPTSSRRWRRCERRALAHRRARRAARPALRGVVRGDRRATRERPVATGHAASAASRTSTRCRSTRGRPARSACAHEEGRRICRCLFYVRHTPEDNGYAHPIEGVVAFVDMARGEVLEIIDTGVVPCADRMWATTSPSPSASRDDLKPIEITQPEGPSFSVEGNHVRWQKWSLRVSMDSVEGLILHRGRLRGRRPRPSCAVPGLGHRDGGPLRRPRPHARLEERIRRGRMGTRADGELPHPRL